MDHHLEIVKTNIKYPIVFYNHQFNKSRPVSSHYHQDIEVVYVVSGKVEACIDGKKEIFYQGEMFIINSHSVHQFNFPEFTHLYTYLLSVDVFKEFQIQSYFFKLKAPSNKEWFKPWPFVIVAINILIAVVSDFESAIRAYQITGDFSGAWWASNEGVFLYGGWWNIVNGIAGLINIFCMTGWWGIYSSKKKDDMLWPDMTWMFILAYDVWNFQYTYLNLPTHSWYCGVALLLAPTFAAAFWNKGGWIQNRANTLALWCMFAQVFPLFQDASRFSVIPALYSDGFMDAAVRPTSANPTIHGCSYTSNSSRSYSTGCDLCSFNCGQRCCIRCDHQTFYEVKEESLQRRDLERHKRLRRSYVSCRIIKIRSMMKKEHCMVREKSLLTGVACQQTFLL